MKSKTKRILAFLCAVVLVATTFLGNWYTKQAEAATDVEPISVDGFDNLTISDFVDSSGNQMATGEYEGSSNGNYSDFYVKDLANFDKKLLSMKITYEGGEYTHSLVVGGTGEWSGFNLRPNGDGSTLYIDSSWAGSIIDKSTYVPPYMTADIAGVDSFVGKELLLQMSFEYGEVVDGVADLTIGVYINGKLYNNEKFTIPDCNVNAMGSHIGLYREVDGSSIIVDNVEWPAEPAWPEGFTYLTIKNFEGLTPGTLTGATTGAHKDYSAINLTSFDNVLLSMNATFTGGSYRTRLDIGGNAGWTGFSVHPNDDGSVLEINNNYGMTTTADLPRLSADVAGVDSFINNEFLLQMSFEYGEVVNNRADVTIGVYIEGKLYNNQKFTIADCDMTKMGSHLAFYSEAEGGNITYGNVIAPIEPVYLDGFGNLTISDFVDGSGNVLTEGEYEGSSSGAHNDYSVSGLTNFDKKLISMNVTFEGGEHKNSIIIGGNGGWCGFNLHPTNDGSQLVVDKTWGGDITSSSTPSLSATTAGLSSFINNEFLLQISFEYGEETNGTADLSMGIYIDGQLYNNEIFTISSCSTSTWGTHLALYRETNGQSIIIGEEVEFDEFAGFTEVTVEDFVDGSGNVMEEKAYTTTTVGAYDTFSLKDYDNFDGKKLALNVMFKYGDGNTRIDIAGAGAWNGVSMWTNTSGSYLYVGSNYGGVSSGTPEFPINISKDSVGISSFLDTKFLLEMTFKYVSDTQIEIGIYVNGVLANNQKYTLTVSDMTKFGDYIGFYREAEESAILIGSVNSASFPVDKGIQPSYRYEKLTFGHFGITDGKYPCVAGDVAVQGPANGRTTLDKTVISGSILLEGSDSSQIIWGGTSGWNGLRMFPTSGGTMQLTWYNGGTGTPITTLNSETAGVAFVGEKYDIMLSSELVDNDGDSNVNDIKVGIWFNGVLYNQEYFIVPNLGNEYGNYFSVYCAAETDTVTLGSVMDLLEQPSENLKKITFAQFGVDDGIYESASDINTEGTYVKGDTVSGTVLCGDIQLINSSAGEIDIFLGSNTNVWTEGIRLTKYGTSTDINLIYQTSSAVNTIESFKPAVAGVDFASEEFNLMWSIELVDYDEDGATDDLKVGVWFNGFLYQQEYEYITNFGADMLGNTFATYCASETSIALNSMVEYAQRPNADFDRITFSDFGLETQEITCGADVVASSKASAYTTLDRVVFSGDFRMSDAENYQIIYGGDSGWSGLRLMIESDGSLNGSWYHSDGSSQLVIWGMPEHLGLDSLTQETFNVMISTELVDDDGDGNKNDIKVGVWFNEVLYEYEGSGYHIVKDWGDQLQNGFSIYSPAGSSTSVMIRNVGDYQKNPYYYEDISAYRGTTKTAPKAPTGYVFAGWYADAEYTEWIGTDVTSGSAWAKFLEDDVLSAKPQVKVNADLSVPTDSTDLRVSTTVDNLLYRRISFFIAKQQSDGTYGSEFNTATTEDNARLVYEKLYAIGDNSTTITYKPTAFSWQSDYFKTFTLTGIPSSDYGTMIKVTPYWITMDGTLVRGKVLETCVNDYTNNKSQAVSLDFIGDDTLPITGFNGPYVISDANDAMLYPDYITDEYFKKIADSGVNVIITSNMDYASYPDQMKKALKLGEKYGIGIYVQDSKLKELTTEADVKARLAEYDSYESFVGIHLVDEPGTSSYKSDSTSGLVSQYSTLAGILNKLDIPTYANVFPIVDTTAAEWWEGIFGDQGITDEDKSNYSAYVSEVNEALDPVALMWDYYPFAIDADDRSTVKTTHPEYFWNMGEIRKQAQADDKPFWAYVQAGSNWNDASAYFDTQIYATTEGQFKWNMNTALAFGAQGIQYFPLIQPYHFAYAGNSAEDKAWDFNRNGLIGAFGNTTQWYDYAVAANTHVGAMDHILMNSYNKQIIAIGSAQSDASGANGVTTTVSYNELTGATGNALIGCFDYKGKTALYVVNYDYDNEGTVTLTFNGTQNITKIEDAVATETSASSLSLSMEAGEGILLVLE